MAEGEPPHLHEQPLRALLLITTLPAPELRDAERWSSKFKHFLKCALAVDPAKRATAEQLLMVCRWDWRPFRGRRHTNFQWPTAHSAPCSSTQAYARNSAHAHLNSPTSSSAAPIHPAGVRAGGVRQVCCARPHRARQAIGGPGPWSPRQPSVFSISSRQVATSRGALVPAGSSRLNDYMRFVGFGHFSHAEAMIAAGRSRSLQLSSTVRRARAAASDGCAYIMIMICTCS